MLYTLLTPLRAVPNNYGDPPSDNHAHDPTRIIFLQVGSSYSIRTGLSSGVTGSIGNSGYDMILLGRRAELRVSRRAVSSEIWRDWG